MAKQKETKQSTMQRLFVYAGKYKYLTIASWILVPDSGWFSFSCDGKHDGRKYEKENGRIPECTRRNVK